MKAETVAIELSVLLEIRERGLRVQSMGMVLEMDHPKSGAMFRSEAAKIIEAVNEAIREQSNG